MLKVPSTFLMLAALLMVSRATTAAAQQSVPGFDSVISESQERIGPTHFKFVGGVEAKRGDTELYADEAEVFTDQDLATGLPPTAWTSIPKPSSGRFTRRTGSPTSSRRRHVRALWRCLRSPTRKPTCTSRARPSKRSAPRSIGSRTAASRPACSQHLAGSSMPGRLC